MIAGEDNRFFCPACDTVLASAEQMQDHLNGKKHRRKQQAMMAALVVAPSMKTLVIAESAQDLLRTV
jgi:Cdc6-like AAA superfamily ATPase